MRRAHRTLALLLAATPLLAIATTSALGSAPAIGAHAPLGTDLLHSERCVRCHSNDPSSVAMRDSKGRNIGMQELWQSTMMANAARDPFFRAMVAAEVAATPSRRAEIEDKCMRCHSPMSSAHGHGDTEYPQRIADLDANDDRALLARDGVSCSVCHAIADVGLGTDATYSGNFPINEQQVLYGPHANLVSQPMFNWTVRNAATSQHVLKSSLCATCHTLFTDTLDPNGRATGHEFAEQTPYLEWRNSVYNDEVTNPGPKAASCQACHVPTTDVDGNPISTRVSRMPFGGDYRQTVARSPYGRHIFVGGNTLIPQILRDNAEALKVTAPAAAFDATIQAARKQLTERTATVRFRSARRSGGRLLLDVEVVNRAGHKLPTGFPSRRAWLRVIVRDRNGANVFASGRFDAEGRLLDARGAVLASEAAGGPVLTHLDRIADPNRVQVYEDLMQDANGALTWRLLRAATHKKDNRLLPDGWTASHPDAADTKPYGVTGDANFAGGSDVVTYDVAAPASAGPYTVEAALYYQTLSPRFAAELFATRAPDIQAFETYYKKANRTPERLAGASTTVP